MSGLLFFFWTFLCRIRGLRLVAERSAALALDLGCFQLWAAVVNKAWMNIFPEDPFCLSGCFLRVNSETLTHMPSTGIGEPCSR